MKIKDMYLKAAKLSHRNHVDGSPGYTCVSIVLANEYDFKYYDCNYIQNFRSIFGPDDFTGASWLSDPTLTKYQQNNRRVLALLFMHEIDKEGL